MEAKSSERRYNTRFRGVPRSIFTYSRSKKSSPKTNQENGLHTDIRDDFVYTKLGKKSHQDRENTSPPKSKIKTEATLQNNKQEKKTPKSKPLPNGIHKETTENSSISKLQKDDLPKKIENAQEIKNEPVDLVKMSDVVIVKKCSNEDQEKKFPKEDTALPTEKKPKKAEKVPPFKLNKNKPPEEIMSPVTDDQQSNSMSIEIPKLEICSPEPSPKSEKDMEDIFFESKSPDSVYSSVNNQKSVWIESKEKLSWNECTVAGYNPKTKMFRCVKCHAVGFMSRIGEHYLGTHCNAKVFHCPQCSYCSAWWRCVRNHMSKNHGVSNAPASMWKNQPLLDEIMQILQNLKYSVDCEDRVEKIAENCGKRYICPKCPYATDRRDLYNRHENIHREEKPFQCYICYKLFNRADHVKKHFCRIHKDFNYDINLIRRLPSKRSRIPVSPSFNGGGMVMPASFNGGGLVSCQDGYPYDELMTGKPAGQSHLMNCLTGSPTMVQMSREIDKTPDFSEKESSSKNDNTFNNSHSNLLTYLTQNAFTPKPIHKSNNNFKNYDLHLPTNDILQEALLKPSTGLAPKKYNCPYCPWTGPNPWALRIHTSMHYKTFCVLCNFKSSETMDLEKHMWENHKKRSCNKCNFLADSLLALDTHMKEAHCQKPQFSCRHCSQTFEARSDLEAHSIFIHSQVLQECKANGCDFCSTDPEILQVHKKEVHSSSASVSQDPSASRTLCLYCGCEFADPQSLTLHEELFHENPLQVAGRRPLNPYGCSVCGYTTPKQPMMIEHMRIHTGQTLHCLAGGGCQFHTPYDTVLREHVLQCHSNDIGTTRCPHCGFHCSDRSSFISHYKELHHPFCCQICEDVEHRCFKPVNPSSSIDSSIKTMFPFAKTIGTNQSEKGTGKRSLEALFPFAKKVELSSLDQSDKDMGRRSRKQTQPRKVVVHDGPVKQPREKFISLYVKKRKKIAQTSLLLKCRLCVKYPLYFRHKQNYLRHRQWHCFKKHRCDKCIQTFSHRYQVLLHCQKKHIQTLTKTS